MNKAIIRDIKLRALLGKLPDADTVVSLVEYTEDLEGTIRELDSYNKAHRRQRGDELDELDYPPPKAPHLAK